MNREIIKIDYNEVDITDNEFYYEILSKYRELDIKEEIDWSKAFRI